MPRKSAKQIEEESNAGQRQKLVAIGAVGLLGLIVVITSFVLARSDRGSIDVSAAITQSNIERAERGEAQVTNLAASTGKGKTNGGLVASGNERPAPVPEIDENASSTATSTASTTDDGTGSTTDDGTSTSTDSGTDQPEENIAESEAAAGEEETEETTEEIQEATDDPDSGSSEESPPADGKEENSTADQ